MSFVSVSRILQQIGRLAPLAVPFLIAGCAKDKNPRPEEPDGGPPRPDEALIPTDCDIEIFTEVEGLHYDVPPYLDSAQTPASPVTVCDKKFVDRTSATLDWEDKTTARATFVTRFAGHSDFFSSPYYKELCVDKTDPALWDRCQEAIRFHNHRNGGGLYDQCFAEYELNGMGENIEVGFGCWGGIFEEVGLFDPALLSTLGSLWMNDMAIKFQEDPLTSKNPPVGEITIRLTATNQESLAQEKFGNSFYTELFPKRSENLFDPENCIPHEGYRVATASGEASIPFFQDGHPLVLDQPLTCTIPGVSIPKGATSLFIDPVECCVGDQGCAVHEGSHVDRISIGLRICCGCKEAL